MNINLSRLTLLGNLQLRNLSNIQESATLLRYQGFINSQLTELRTAYCRSEPFNQSVTPTGLTSHCLINIHEAALTIVGLLDPHPGSLCLQRSSAASADDTRRGGGDRDQSRASSINDHIRKNGKCGLEAEFQEGGDTADHKNAGLCLRCYSWLLLGAPVCFQMETAPQTRPLLCNTSHLT